MLLTAAACHRNRDAPGLNPAPAPAPRPTAPSALDLASDTLDRNGFFVNPRWAGATLPDVAELCGGFADTVRTSTSFLGGCTRYRSEIGFVLPQIRLGPLCAGTIGHVNWRATRDHLPPESSAATVWGRVFAAEETPIGGAFGGVGNYDGDIGLMLQTPGDPGRTAGDPYVKNGSPGSGSRMLELEFSRTELKSLWSESAWGGLAGGGNAVQSDKVHDFVDGRLAVAVGVFGVDGIHDAHAELHPVFALAIRTDADRFTETWDVFARNWGNEGMCGQAEQKLGLKDRTLYLWLPWRAGATSARVTFTGAATVLTNTFAKDSIAVPLPIKGFGIHLVTDGLVEITWLGNPDKPDALRVKPVAWSHEVTPEERARAMHLHLGGILHQ